MGDARLFTRLADALGASGPSDELTHGFHTFPARFHPRLARRLLEDVAPGARILDPFVGSGTTLVEAAVVGAAGLGVDLNPLAVWLSRLKAQRWSEGKRRTLARATDAVTARVLEEVRASRRRSAASTARRGPRFDDPRYYPPHVFRELMALRLAIEDVGRALAGDERQALLLLFSSIIMKFSRLRADTDAAIVERQTPRGAPTRLLARRAEELLRRLAELAARIPPGTPVPDVRLGDARRLAHVSTASVDLIVTSPPYLGTYDYAGHHARRFAWLGLDPAPLLAGEMGARRASTGHDALADWRHDVQSFIGEMARVLRPGGWAYLLVGDSRVGQQRVLGYEEYERPDLPLERAARASQSRSLAGDTDGQPRQEHLLALRHRG